MEGELRIVNPSDEELVECVQRGEREQFLELYRRHHRRIEAYARRQLRNSEAARDIASETFLQAFKSVDRFRTDKRISYLGYLFLLCRRLVINETKRLAASPVVSQVANEQQALEDLPDSAPLSISLMLDAERRQAVREALAQLGDEDREVICLAFEQELSRSDIMQILEKPSVAAVRSHLYRALGRLRSIMLRQGYFTPVGTDEHE